MAINIHPAVVHFPIALLTVYSVLELVSFGKWKDNKNLFNAKFLLLIIGFFASLVALQTGEIAEKSDIALGQHSLIEVHSLWAGISTWIFGILLVYYVLVLISMIDGFRFSWLKNFSLKVSRIEFLRYRLTKILALVGLVAMIITGALGGAIVYGPDVDPIVSMIYGWFF